MKRKTRLWAYAWMCVCVCVCVLCVDVCHHVMYSRFWIIQHSPALLFLERCEWEFRKNMMIIKIRLYYITWRTIIVSVFLKFVLATTPLKFWTERLFLRNFSQKKKKKCLAEERGKSARGGSARFEAVEARRFWLAFLLALVAFPARRASPLRSSRHALRSLSSETTTGTT